jgi:hypothetical protein
MFDMFLLNQCCISLVESVSAEISPMVGTEPQHVSLLTVHRTDDA